MYGGLPQADQMKVACRLTIATPVDMSRLLQIFDRASGNSRKVIVATNVAEASVTIPGIVYVIDCGFVKMKGFNPETGIDSLVVCLPHSIRTCCDPSPLDYTHFKSLRRPTRWTSWAHSLWQGLSPLHRGGSEPMFCSVILLTDDNDARNAPFQRHDFLPL